MVKLKIGRMSLEIRPKDMEDIILSKFARGEVDSYVSSEIERDSWLFKPHEIEITPVDIHESEEHILIRTSKHEEKSNVQLRQQDYTGGVYADVEQEISFNARVPMDSLPETYTLVDIANAMEIQYECNVWLSNKHSVSGEKPPF